MLTVTIFMKLINKDIIFLHIYEKMRQTIKEFDFYH